MHPHLIPRLRICVLLSLSFAVLMDVLVAPSKGGRRYPKTKKAAQFKPRSFAGKTPVKVWWEQETKRDKKTIQSRDDDVNCECPTLVDVCSRDHVQGRKPEVRLRAVFTARTLR